MKIKPGFELRSVAGESVVVATGAENIDFSKIISLNSSAAYLWNEVSGKEFTAETLADLLAGEYEVTKEKALKDSEVLIESWLKAEIITR